MKRRAFGSVVGFAVLATVIAGCGGRAEPIATPNINESAPASSAKVYLDNGNNISKSQSGKVTIVEFTDYQCPGCKSYHPHIEALAKEYAGRINVQVRNFPLESIHNNSRIAAQAAEAIRLDDSNLYPAFAALLFANQEEWGQLDRQNAIEKFVGYAKDVHADEKTFRDSVDSQEVRDIVKNDLADAESLALPGTPTIYLNGSRLSGISPEALSQEVESLLAK